MRAGSAERREKGAGDGLEEGKGWVLRLLREGLSGNPLAVGAEEGLGGSAFDDGEEGFLAAVGGGEVELVEGEERGGDDGGEDEHGGDDAVEADAGGLHGGELRRAGERAEGDEDGDQDAEGVTL